MHKDLNKFVFWCLLQWFNCLITSLSLIFVWINAFIYILPPLTNVVFIYSFPLLSGEHFPIRWLSLAFILNFQHLYFACAASFNMIISPNQFLLKDILNILAFSYRINGVFIKIKIKMGEQFFWGPPLPQICN